MSFGKDEEVLLNYFFRTTNIGYKLRTGYSLTRLDVVDKILETFFEGDIDDKKDTFLIMDDFGWFTVRIYNYLMEKLKNKFPNIAERKKNVISRLFIFPKDERSKVIVKKTMEYSKIGNEIKIFDNIDELNIKFDNVIGNPPFSISQEQNKNILKCDSNSYTKNLPAVYHLYVEKAFLMANKYVSMIIPSRFLTRVAKGVPNEFIDDILKSDSFVIINDYEDSNKMFQDIKIRGGIVYFLWKKDYHGDCRYYFHECNSDDVISRCGKLDNLNLGIVLRNPKVHSIVQKIISVEGNYYQNKNFSNLITPKRYFGLESNWNEYNDEKTDIYNIKYYTLENSIRTFKWICNNQLEKGQFLKNQWKIYLPATYGKGVMNDSPNIFIGEPGSICSNTYLTIGYGRKFTEEQCHNIISYIRTKFFRFLVGTIKKTPTGTRKVYKLVPIQDFSKPWTDKELYEKYGFSDEEISLIEELKD